MQKHFLDAILSASPSDTIAAEDVARIALKPAHRVTAELKRNGVTKITRRHAISLACRWNEELMDELLERFDNLRGQLADEKLLTKRLLHNVPAPAAHSVSAARVSIKRQFDFAIGYQTRHYSHFLPCTNLDEEAFERIMDTAPDSVKERIGWDENSMLNCDELPFLCDYLESLS